MKLELSKVQKRAVLHKDGPMLVLAGPGSGKTLVITHRVHHLVQNHHISPSNILVITFTKAAAREMQERYLKLSETDSVSRVTFGTFHAIFFKILKHSYHLSAANLISEDEKFAFFREKIHQYGMDFEDEADLILLITSEISMIKNNRILLEHFYPQSCSRDEFVRIYQDYTQFLKRNKKLDFDDMLVYTYELFDKRRDILLAWQNKYRYILIDEFQDVNKIQYDVIRMLAGETNNLFAVGDDDQSIYSFRGARPEIMMSMPKEMERLEKVVLSENYRSGSKITAIAQKLISQNEVRFQKKIVSKTSIEGCVQYLSFKNQREQNLHMIKKLLQNPDEYHNTSVLFRTNTQIRLLMSQLMEHNIPFVTKEQIPDLYEHWMAKDLFAYIRIAQGSRERSDFLKIMNRPRRYLSRESMDSSTVAFDVWEEFYSAQPWIMERIAKLQADIRELARMKPFAAVNYIRKGIGYDDFCREYAAERNLKPEELLGFLDDLQESTREFKSYQEWGEHIRKYKNELKQMHKDKKQNLNAVLLATYHGAKGLEFDSVYLIEANEGIVPYKKAVLPNEIEEERRMFYVGMTRAKKNLYMYSICEFNNHDLEVSRFVKECSMIDYSSSSSASSNSSSKRADTASYSSSSSILSSVGLPSSSSE